MSADQEQPREKPRYPLSWPEGWKRTTVRKAAQFGKAGTVTGQFSRTDIKRLSVENAFDRLERELEAFDIKGDTVIVSTNLKLNMRGVPSGNAGEPSDPGVAVYWTRNGKAQCMAIDVYTRVADNLAAVAASLAAMRAIERHGGAQILDRAFIGFAQISERRGRPWREIFAYKEHERPSFDHVDDRYKRMARTVHSDAGGSHDAMVELNAAREEARRELGS